MPGFVASAGHPGGNSHGGVSRFFDFSKKWLEQLTEVVGIGSRPSENGVVAYPPTCRRATCRGLSELKSLFQVRSFGGLHHKYVSRLGFWYTQALVQNPRSLDLRRDLLQSNQACQFADLDFLVFPQSHQ